MTQSNTTFIASRRGFIAGATGTLLTGCVSCPESDWPDVKFTKAFRDVHTHFFNLADLPARGFLKHVVLPERAPDLSPTFEAIADLVTHFLKSRAMSAKQELNGRRIGVSGSLNSEEKFARDVAKRIVLKAGIVETPVDASKYQSQSTDCSLADDLVAQEPTNQICGESSADAVSTEALAESYLAAKSLFLDRLQVWGSEAEDSNSQEEIIYENLLPFILDPAHKDDGLGDSFSSLFHSEVGLSVEGAGRPGCHNSGCSSDDEPIAQRINIKQLLGWAYLLHQCRESHVKRYLSAINSGSRCKPQAAVNLMVDFDQWVDDQPKDGSNMIDQIVFWAAFAAQEEVASRLTIHNFAGLDPLKEAEVEWNGNVTSTLNWLQGVTENGDPSVVPISGIKLYPPMGFRPIGNSDLAGADFVGQNGIEGRVVERWCQAGQDPETIGPKLDEQLRNIYAYCVKNDLPVLAHADCGNAAGDCFGERANPAYWADVVGDPNFRGLRLCLAHFSEADDFIKAMSNQCDPEKVWATSSTARLLQMNQEVNTNVFVDLGYLSALVEGENWRTKSAAFFRHLRNYCSVYDPGCHHIMFGSDWIMLGQQESHDRYLSNMLAGLSEAGWEPSWQERLLSENFMRFVHGAV